MSEAPGRVCPPRYRYGASAVAHAPERRAETLYVIGGLYGNRPALDAVDALAAAESGPVTLCFNGDFHWFDVDDAAFVEVNARALRHDALLGNVEAELLADSEAAGCGCAYPEMVNAETVDRSNWVHARLKTTAQRHCEALAGLGALPMVARYRIGDVAIGVVHGDAEALAGWRFDAAALDDPRIASGWRRRSWRPASMCSPAAIPACPRCAVSVSRACLSGSSTTVRRACPISPIPGLASSPASA